MALARPIDRPNSSRAAPGLRHPEVAAKINGQMIWSTMIIVVGSIVAFLASVAATDANGVFSSAALVFLVALLTAIAVEARCGLRNLVRVDLFMLAALYLLTFLEFLLPQEPVTIVGRDAALTAVGAVLVSFVGMSIGRHAFPTMHSPTRLTNLNVSPSSTIWLMAVCAFIGYLYMLLAVDFNVLEMVYQIQQPRFTQPWSRGRLGSWATLVNQLSLVTYAIPGLAGAVVAQSTRYSIIQIVAALFILAFVLFEAFASGTRNIFLIHIVTFATSYAILVPRLTLGRALRLGVPALLVAGFAITAMLTIRTVGLENFSGGTPSSRLSVDMNIINIAQIGEVFPRSVPYLGLEVPYIFATGPIPRAIWPGKPEGLSYSVNDAVGVGDYMTVSASFPGELVMSGGFLAILIGSLVAGAVAARWNRFGSTATSNVALITYAIGFFPAGIMMRSLMSSAQAFLPVAALFIYAGMIARAPRQNP